MTSAAESGRPSMCKVHPAAIVPAGVTLGRDVEIGPFAVIEPGATIGEGCVIGAHVVIGPEVRLGARVRVFPGAVLGTHPQIRPLPTTAGPLDVGADTVIREHATLNGGSRGPTRIGRRCLVMTGAHVGHDCVVGDEVTLINGATLGGFVEIEHHAAVSAMVPVHQFVRIGAYSYVGGGFRVVQDVPPYLLAAGEPLRPYGLNVVGLRRAGFSEDQLRGLRAIYRHFFRSGLNTSQALARIDELEPSPERDHFAAFVAASTRGIIR